MPYYKGMVQFFAADGRLSHSGDLLDVHFEAPNAEAAMDHMLVTRSSFVQRRAVNVQVTQVNLHLAQQLGPHGIYGPGRRRDLAPDLGRIPQTIPLSATELAAMIPDGETVLYRNHQWLVTEAGLYSGDGEHAVFIGKGELHAKTQRDGEELYQWPVDLVRNTWIDAYALCAAFEQALAHHDPDEAFDRRIYRNSVYSARTLSAQQIASPDHAGMSLV